MYRWVKEFLFGKLCLERFWFNIRLDPWTKGRRVRFEKRTVIVSTRSFLFEVHNARFKLSPAISGLFVLKKHGFSVLVTKRGKNLFFCLWILKYETPNERDFLDSDLASIRFNRMCPGKSPQILTLTVVVWYWSLLISISYYILRFQGRTTQCCWVRTISREKYPCLSHK